MILTGKAKEYFIDYLWESEFKKEDYKEYEDYIENQKESHTNADIIEWFDSVGIYIELNRFTMGLKFEFWHYTISDIKGVNLNSHLENRSNIDSRQEATKKAIIKANEIYNLQFSE